MMPPIKTDGKCCSPESGIATKKLNIAKSFGSGRDTRARLHRHAHAAALCSEEKMCLLKNSSTHP